jgi:hypothetical protein
VSVGRVDIDPGQCRGDAADQIARTSGNDVSNIAQRVEYAAEEPGGILRFSRGTARSC